MKSIPYGKQYISEEDLKAVREVLTADFLTQGPKINEFEAHFANYVDAKYAVAVSNGTAALHLSCMALGVTEGTRVLSTPITFAASTNAVLYCGGTVDFVDIDPDTYLIDLEKLEAKLAGVPRGTYSGVIPVDFAGYPCDMEALRHIADKYDLWIIEDVCHAPGASFKDSSDTVQKSGNGAYADLQIFSFHPVKHIATGEGGMITTNNEKLYNEVAMLRTHGITKDPAILEENHGGWYYEMHELGYNYRLTDIQAALGVSQLQRASQGIEARNRIAQTYNAAFEQLPIKTPRVAANISHAYHLYVIQTERRKELYDHLRSHGIYAQIHYIPVHLQPYYKKNFGFAKGDFPVAEAYYERCLSLPMFPTLSAEDQEYVIQTVVSFFN